VSTPTTGSANTSVDVQGMISAQQDFQNALDQVNTAFQDMSEEQSTLAANWTGEAASTFGKALATYLDDLANVQKQLAGMCEKLSSHTGVYTNTHEQSSEMASAFMQGLPGLQGL
jgi:WXG100 family type VII secretion target